MSTTLDDYSRYIIEWKLCTTMNAEDDHSQYHESFGNVTPADVYSGRDQTILSERRTTKEKTMKQRRLINQKRVV